jgi:hypothetical protein
MTNEPSQVAEQIQRVVAAMVVPHQAEGGSAT